MQKRNFAINSLRAASGLILTGLLASAAYADTHVPGATEFVPVTPCRVARTSKSLDGPLLDDTPRFFCAFNDGGDCDAAALIAQGAFEDCPLPAGIALEDVWGAMINVTIDNTTGHGTGFGFTTVSVSPTPDPAVRAVVTADVPEQIIANTVTVKLCDLAAPGCDADSFDPLSTRHFGADAKFNDTHILIDLIGLLVNPAPKN
jgi:hypothetical protein